MKTVSRRLYPFSFLNLMLPVSYTALHIDHSVAFPVESISTDNCCTLLSFKALHRHNLTKWCISIISPNRF